MSELAIRSLPSYFPAPIDRQPVTQTPTDVSTWFINHGTEPAPTPRLLTSSEFRFDSFSVGKQRDILQFVGEMGIDSEFGLPSLGHLQVYIAKIIAQRDVEYDEAASDKVEKVLTGIMQMGATELMLANKLPSGANIVGTRIILAIKNYYSGDQLRKARMVMQGCFDREASLIISDSASVSCLAVRIFFLLPF